MPRRWKEIVRLWFRGPRFEGHAIDIPVLTEIIRYQELVRAVAKATYRKQHPEAGRLPNRFDEILTLRFSEIIQGSAVIPLEAPEEYEETPFFDVSQSGTPAQGSADLIRDCVAAAADGEALPDRFPRSCLRPLMDFGQGLGPADAIRLATPHKPEFVAYSQVARDHLSELLAAPYEDIVVISGKVLEADVGKQRFRLHPPGKPGVSVSFGELQEDVVIRALKEQISCIRNISIEVTAGEEVGQRVPIWDQIAAIGHEIPDEIVASVPPDASLRLDEYLYGKDTE